jgi:hypothetical protein
LENHNVTNGDVTCSINHVTVTLLSLSSQFGPLSHLGSVQHFDFKLLTTITSNTEATLGSLSAQFPLPSVHLFGNREFSRVLRDSARTVYEENTLVPAI